MSELTAKQSAIRLATVANGVALYRRVMAKYGQANRTDNDNDYYSLEANYISSRLADKLLSQTGAAKWSTRLISQ